MTPSDHFGLDTAPTNHQASWSEEVASSPSRTGWSSMNQRLREAVKEEAGNVHQAQPCKNLLAYLIQRGVESTYI